MYTNAGRVVNTSDLVAMTDKYIKDWRVDHELLDHTWVFRSVEIGFTRYKSIDTTFPAEGKVSLCQFLTNSRFHVVDPLPREIVDAIQLALEFVVVVSNYRSPFVVDEWRRPSIDNMLGHDTSKPGTSKDTGFIGRWMLDRGWCPFHLEELTQRMTFADLVYIANLSRPDSLDYEACTSTRCRYAYVDNTC
jgi:hypothetical protein